MKLRVTPALLQLLHDAGSDPTLPHELKAQAAAACVAGAGGSVEWGAIKAIVHHSKQQKGADAVPPLDELCRGSSIAFPQPRKREAMPPELQRRLQQLKARLEQQQYDAMVADVTQDERRAAALREGSLATYRQQISFGIHILAMMAAFYAFGHVAGMALSSNRAMHPLFGLVGMVLAMLLETVLYILRTTMPPKLHQQAARRAVAARVAAQQQRHMREAAAAGQEAGLAGAGAEGGATAWDVAASSSSGPLDSDLLPPGEQKLPEEKKDD
ncbi:hypothetical protein ACK3TF_000861 [Chlorella vulgaris]